MTTTCSQWLQLLAAYKAGQSSNAAEVKASADRAKIDDKVGGESDATVNSELQRWNRKS